MFGSLLARPPIVAGIEWIFGVLVRIIVDKSTIPSCLKEVLGRRY